MKLNGTKVASIIKDICKARIDVLKKFYKIPKLAIIQVGENSASNIYVKNKIKDCIEVGIESNLYVFEDVRGDIHQMARIRHLVQELNCDKSVDGIMCQLPMEGVDPRYQRRILDLIADEKDVDGLCSDIFTAINVPFSGDRFIPCTPHGILMLLNAYSFNTLLKGIKTTIVGRSNLVTKPLAQLLINEGAMVTVAHSECDRRDIISAMRGSQLIISGVGKPHIWNIPECVNVANQPILIDIGTSKGDNDKLVGDFCGIELMDHSELIHYTPVPGGVGPMTRAVLLLHVVDACERRLTNKEDSTCHTLEIIEPNLKSAYKRLMRQSKVNEKS